ncbi:MAG: carboxypeptidase regulatory-like domain-containing protein [Planctomycetota bacterium]
MPSLPGIVLILAATLALPAITSAPQLECRGTVVDEAGTPLEGARVRVIGWTDLGQRLPTTARLLAEGTTGKDGAFGFEVSPENVAGISAADVVAEKEGLAMAWVRWPIHKDRSLETKIALGSPLSIGGTVVDDSGKPIHDAEVRMVLRDDDDWSTLCSDSALALLSCRTDPGGHFLFAQIPAYASADLVVSAPGRATTFATTASSSTSASLRRNTDIVIRLEPEAVIEGEVVVQETGEPCPAAVLVIGPALEPDTYYSIETLSLPRTLVVCDESGRFRAGGLAAGPCHIFLCDTWKDAAQWSLLPLKVQTLRGEVTRHVRVELVEAGLLEIIVKDHATGSPVSAASVRLSDPDGNWAESRDAMTDEAGVARFYLPPGERFDVSVIKAGYRIGLPEGPLTAEAGQTTRQLVQLEALAKLRGVVVDTWGEPVPGAVFAWPAEDSKVRTGASGEFELAYYPEWLDEAAQSPGESAPLEESSLALWVRHLERHLAAHLRVRDATSTLRVVLRKALTVTGRVVDIDGQPIIGAQIGFSARDERGTLSFILERIRTDGEGRYTIKAISPGLTLEITASAGELDHGETEIRIEAPHGRDVEARDIVLQSARLKGIVVDRSGEPVPGAVVAISPFPAQGAPEPITTGEGGEFEATYEPGALEEYGETLALFVREPQRNLAAYVMVDDRRSPQRVLLEPGITITGMVVDPDGHPIAQAEIIPSLLTDDFWSLSLFPQRIPVDTEGRYTLAAIPPDSTLQIRALAKGYGQCEAEVYADPTEGESVEAQAIVLDRALLSISGIVKRDDGNPVARASLWAHGDGQQDRPAQADEEGKFTIDGLCAGDVTVHAVTPSLDGSAEVPAGATGVEIIVRETARDDDVIKEEPEGVPTSLLGERLPNLSELSSDLDPSLVDGKRILVCFCDMNQRPSRHFVKSLAKAAEELARHDMILLTVDVSGNGAEAVHEWARTAKVPFPIACLGENSRDTLLAWGVAALPWIIVADRSQVVQAEGVMLDELQEVLASLGDK